MRRFELVEGTASKFWEIEQNDSDLNIAWGRIGTAGQSQTKSFADAAKALAALNKLVKEKTAKGYSETGSAASGAAAPATTPAANPAPAAKAAAPKPAKAAASKTAAAAPAAAVAPAAATAPAESLDAQCERVFEAVRAQIADGSFKLGHDLSAAQLKRLHGVSDLGASMAFDQLKSTGMLYGWGSTAKVQDKAQAIAKALGEERAQQLAEMASQPQATTTAVTDAGTPPWAQGELLRLPAGLRNLAYATRRHPQKSPQPSAAAAWHLVRPMAKDNGRVDLAGCEPLLRPALERQLSRLTLAEPAADIEADTLLLARAMGTRRYHGDAEIGSHLIDYLVAQYGLPGAVDIYLASQQIQVSSSYDSKAKGHVSTLSYTVTSPVSDSWYGPLGQTEEQMRKHLSAAPEEEWQVCAEKIAAALPTLHPSRKTAVVLLVPECSDMTHALAFELTAEKDTPENAHWLLLTVTDPAAIAALVKVKQSYSSGLWDNQRMVATLLLERGLDAMALLERGAAQDEAGDALAAMGTPEAVTALARVASGSKGALARLALAVDRWPLAAMVALAKLIASGGKDAGFLTPSLTRLLRAHSGQVDALRPWLDSAAQASIDRQLALLAGPAEVATMSELPQVLAAPPWQAKVQKKAATALALAPLTLEPMEQWADGAREQALQLNQWEQKRFDSASKNVLELVDRLGFDDNKKQFKHLLENAAAAIRQRDTEALIAAWRAMVEQRKKERYYWFYFYAEYISLLPEEMAAPFWNAVAGEATDTRGVDFMAAKLGLAGLPGLLAMVRSKPSENLELALNFGAVELAAPAARAFAKLKSLRDAGRQWLLRYPEHAACALLAPALGKPGEARDCAGSALRLLQANGHAALLQEVAARYGREDVVSALQAVLDENPLDRFPTKRAKLPEWWQPRGWRRPQLANDKALPDEALDALGQMLGFPTNEEVYAGIADVQAACTRESLADFGWDAFSAWLEAGAPSKEGWALTALGLLGTDETARKLTPFIRTWPGESAHARAVTGLDVLAGIGTDVALMLLNGIAQKIKFKGLQDKAREKIQAIAEARGLSTEELEDRLAPDLGLDAQGTLKLDFGPRAFVVGFDETLKPYVRELDADGRPGARLPDLPKPKKSDDATLSKEATERFKLLKKDVRTIASQQLLRLEVAMCARRRWTPELFRTFLVEHPLVRHIVQRLIWGVYALPGQSSYGGQLQACFRVAEDGSFTTAEDDDFELPEGENIRIGVPHALELSAADAAAFGQVFADYELLQPFAQIGRDTYTLSEDEAKALKLERWKGAKVPTGRVLGLVNKGWRRGQAQDGGGIWYFTKPLGQHKVIELYLDPGIIVGMVDEYPEQELGDVHVGKPASWGEIDKPEAFTLLDPISASELIRDLEALRA
ncbi:MAG: DUF4132 domain-containing protein [Acidovorax sp.]|jgi:predicted DNA-binding WGR domain protein|nr:DUF4132 domain-containing protein [Acidovorax sp.]